MRSFAVFASLTVAVNASGNSDRAARQRQLLQELLESRRARSGEMVLDSSHVPNATPGRRIIVPNRRDIANLNEFMARAQTMLQSRMDIDAGNIPQVSDQQETE